LGLKEDSSWFNKQNPKDAIKPLVPTTICVWSMVTMTAMMETCGMTDLIANSIAGFISHGYALIAPWLGAIGAFITGSNTNFQSLIWIIANPY